MNDSQPKKSYAATIVTSVATVAALLFAFLWLAEPSRRTTEVLREVPKRVEVIKEVPVERVREVPKEVIKEIEVSAKLTDAQQAAIDFAARFFSAPILTDDDEALYKLDSVDVRVHLNDAVQKVVSEDRVKNKFELILRRHNIHLDEKSPAWLDLAYEGLWDKEKIFLTYARRMRLQQFATIGRKGDLRRTIVTVWEKGAYGYAGGKIAEEAFLTDVEESAEEFANKYLAIQEKIK